MEEEEQKVYGREILNECEMEGDADVNMSAADDDAASKLQRLYLELVQKVEAYRLDRYTKSEKTGRSRWLWSCFIPQTLYAPVKGLYLYGGVGTGKTMLMDLFFNQLPDDWRKKRIHFHDFILNVHSSLQGHNHSWRQTGSWRWACGCTK